MFKAKNTISFMAIVSTTVALGAQGPILHVHVVQKFASRAAHFASKLGHVSHLDSKRGQFELTLKQGINPQKAAMDLLQDVDVKSVTGAGIHISELTLMQSRSNAARELAKFPAKPHQKGSSPAAADDDHDGPDYLRALHYIIDRRAYPHDRVDWSAYTRAEDHAKRMNPATWLAAPRHGNAHANVIDPLSGSWTLLGPKNLAVPYQTYYGVPPLTGRVNAVAYDPSSSSTYYLGGAEGGVWKTTNGGSSFTCLSNGWPTETVDGLAVDPTNDQVIYAAIGDVPGGLFFPGGIMKTTDGGATWTSIGASQFGDQPMAAVIIDPDNHNRLIAASGWYKGVYVSSDGGNTWASTLNDNNNAFYDLSIGVPNNSGVRTLYAVDGTSIWSSTDMGSTWTHGASNFSSVKSLAASAVTAGTVYVMDSNNQTLSKSTNSGASFSDVTGNLGSVVNWSQAWYDYYLKCGKLNGQDDLFVGLISVAESTTGGNNWTDIGQTETGNAPTHNDAHACMINPQNPNQALFGNDGGFYVANRGTGGAWNWTSLNNSGLCLTMFYHGRWSASNPSSMIGGTQDNATPVATGDLNNWGNVAGGDGGGVAIDKDNESIQYGTIYGFTVYQTTDDWNSENDISPNIGGDNSPFVTPIFGDPVNGNLVYGCTNYLYRWDQSTQQWTSHLGGTDLTSGSLVNTVGVAPSNNHVVYTGSDSGDLFMSTSQGNSWIRINDASLPNRAITSISVNPNNPNDILVGLSGSGTGHLYECTNTAAATPVFNSVSGSNNGSLPDVSLNCIARDPLDPVNTIYVGTDIGVFASNNAGSTWYNATIPLGLPAVQVTDLQVTNFRALQISTYGRGMWTINIQSTNVQVPVSYQVIDGTQTSGNLASLSSDDGNNLVVQPGFFNQKGYLALVSATFTMPSNQTVTGLTVQTKTTDYPVIPVRLLVLNPSTNQYIDLGTVGQGADGSISIPGNLSQYISSAGKVTVAVEVAYLKPTLFSIQPIKIDRINLSVTSY